MKKIAIPLFSFLMVACTQPSPVSPSSTPADNEISSGKEEEKTVKMEEKSMEADAVTSATAMPNHSSFNGTLVVPPQKHATVTLTMGGTVHTVSLLPGEYVKKGTVLVTLENPDFITLQQTYLDAHAQTEYLETEYHRQERLSSEEAASQKRFQQSKADYLSMKSRLDAAAAQLTLLGITPAELLKKGITPYLEIKSPLNGYVAGQTPNIGKYIPAGAPVCEVIDKGETLLCLTAYEKDLENLSPGNRVQFRVNGMGDQVFEATLFSIGQQLDEVNRSLEMYARVKDTNPRFRPGMYVTAHIEKK